MKVEEAIEIIKQLQKMPSLKLNFEEHNALAMAIFTIEESIKVKEEKVKK